MHILTFELGEGDRIDFWWTGKTLRKIYAPLSVYRTKERGLREFVCQQNGQFGWNLNFRLALSEWECKIGGTFTDTCKGASK